MQAEREDEPRFQRLKEERQFQEGSYYEFTKFPYELRRRLAGKPEVGIVFKMTSIEQDEEHLTVTMNYPCEFVDGQWTDKDTEHYLILMIRPYHIEDKDRRRRANMADWRAEGAVSIADDGPYGVADEIRRRVEPNVNRVDHPLTTADFDWDLVQRVGDFVLREWDRGGEGLRPVPSPSFPTLKL